LGISVENDEGSDKYKQKKRRKMSKIDFNEVVERICAENQRFHPSAYQFVRESLDYTFKTLQERGEMKARSHISGEILLDGLRAYALDQYGPMARTVLDYWGVECCEDIGQVVFDLINYGVLGKTEQDRQEDFEGGYNFEDAFEKPFRPDTVDNQDFEAPKADR